MNDLSSSVKALEGFAGKDIGLTLKKIEVQLAQGSAKDCIDLNGSLNIGGPILSAAATVKRATAQIDVLIHAVGILHLLPSILETGERIQYLSLGAGNTGKKYDLETDRQIAEFTFIAWRGGSEAIRQSKLFVDFIHLAEAETNKRKNLFVLGLQHPLKFLNSKRTLRSVLSRRPDELRLLVQNYRDELMYVNEYYSIHAPFVSVVDVSSFLPDTLLATVDPEAEV